MNKNIIKEHLRKTFVSEADTPGITITDKSKKESGKINKQGLKDYAKVVEKDAKKEDKEMSKNKFNYTDKFQKTYHDEMEIMNGQEMLQYDMNPSEEFKKKAKEGIEGSSKMGNEGGVGNAEAAWEASSDKFGKDFVKRVKSSTKKRSEETPTLNLRGRDIQADMKDTGHKPYAIEENIFNTAQMGGVTSSKGTAGYVNNTSKMDKDYRDSVRKPAKPTTDDKKTVKEIGDMGKWNKSSEKEKHITNFAAGSPEEAEFRKRLKKQDDIYTKNIQYLKDKKQGVTEISAPKKPLSEKGVNTLTSWVTSLGAKEAAVKLINQLSQTGMISDLPDTMEYGNGLNKVTSLLQKGDYNNAFHTAKTLANKLEKKAMKDMMGETQSKAAVVSDKKVLDKKKADFVPDEDYEKTSREVEYGINPNSQDNNNKDNNKKIKTESMKRLKFKSAFNGLGNALKLIPESYRTDNKVFEMTDGNESYKIRWEGTLNEGKAVVLMASDKTLVNEDINRMKALFGYKSQDTLGLVKGNARIDENKAFGDMLGKMKQLINEGEDMMETEAPKAKEGNWEEQKKKAPEATKNISTAKGKATTAKPTEKNWDETTGGEKMMETEAPKAKESNPDKAKKQAPEAKENISTAKGKANSTAKPAEKNWDETSGGEKMFDGVAPTPKEGHWEDNPPAQASEAKKHVHLKESEIMSEEEEELETDDLENTKSNDDAYEKAFDSMDGEEEEEETGDSWNKADDEDESSEMEPSSEMGGDLPMDDTSDDEEAISVPKPMGKGGFTLLNSPSSGRYFIKGPGLPLQGMEVPNELLSIASNKSMKATERAIIIAKKLEDMPDEVSVEDDDDMM
jgi:hypothetical protein